MHVAPCNIVICRQPRHRRRDGKFNLGTSSNPLVPAPWVAMENGVSQDDSLALLFEATLKIRLSEATAHVDTAATMPHIKRILAMKVGLPCASGVVQGGRVCKPCAGVVLALLRTRCSHTTAPTCRCCFLRVRTVHRVLSIVLCPFLLFKQRCERLNDFSSVACCRGMADADITIKGGSETKRRFAANDVFGAGCVISYIACGASSIDMLIYLTRLAVLTLLMPIVGRRNIFDVADEDGKTDICVRW